MRLGGYERLYHNQYGEPNGVHESQRSKKARLRVYNTLCRLAAVITRCPTLYAIRLAWAEATSFISISSSIL